MTSFRKGRATTAESVLRGHPDKVCDQIADALLDVFLAANPRARSAVEVLATQSGVVLAGEVSGVTTSEADVEASVRETLRRVGYCAGSGYDPAAVPVLNFLTEQSAEISDAVTGDGNPLGQGAGDQGIMYGYATDETPERLPAAAALCQRLAMALDARLDRSDLPGLGPDGKVQVTLSADGVLDTVVVSIQHSAEVPTCTVRRLVEPVVSEALGTPRRLLVNPSGSFTVGGPAADVGLTGRKLMVDSYGGLARHGGGAFSGKDPSKVDRTGAYAARWVARSLVDAGHASRVEVSLAYAIGVAKPVMVSIDTFGTATALSDADLATVVRGSFDLRPGAITADLGLLDAIYAATAAHGHFGRAVFPWEQALPLSRPDAVGDSS